MGDGTFMDKNFIEELNKYPYESLMFKLGNCETRLARSQS